MVPSDEHQPSIGNRRVWASQWYRLTPRSFKHFELFFESDQIILVFAGESYKSFLLRQDGREQRAQTIGQEHRDLPTEKLLAQERAESIQIDTVEQIRVADGTLIRKPKLVIETIDGEYIFYHYSRTHDVEPLIQELTACYNTLELLYNGEKAGT